MLLNFDEIKKEDVLTAGGKGANLGEMTAAGIAVPDGFVVTAEAYRAFLKENDLEGIFRKELLAAGTDEAKLLETAQTLRELIGRGRLPEEVETAIRERYAKLGADARVAVRSSATAEDLPDASFAGQQETYLNVRGIDEVLQKVKDCYASLWGNRAVCYRCNQGYDQLSVALAVVIQQMVESEKAGVLFTVNPITHDRNEIQINASYGLGESVVSGRVTADSYLCDRTGAVKSCEVGSKQTQIVYAQSDTKEVPVSNQMQQARAITTLGSDLSAEKELIAAYLKDSKIKGKAKENMAFQLEKMPFAYRPLDYDYMLTINHQKAKIFQENGIVLMSDPQMDEDGIQTLPRAKIGVNANIFKLFGTLKLFKNFDLCAETCRSFMAVELITACRRGRLIDDDLEKIRRRNEKHALSQKVWDASKLLVFDADGDVLKGVSGSAGVAVGTVCIVHGPEEFYKMHKGDILVCHLTDPEWTPLFALASAVVADTGSALSHAAIVAREYGIPAVLGVGFATTKFKDGDTIKVDGDRGEVQHC